MSISLLLVIITCATSIYAFGKPEIVERFRFNAYAVAQKKDYVRLLSHGFLHGGWLHLGINMYVLWEFGPTVENLFSHPGLFPHTFSFGKLTYVLMYFLAILISPIPALLKYKNNAGYNAVGASGAISALVFCLILLAPSLLIGLIFIPIRVPAYILGILYLAYSFFMSNRKADHIAHDAHISGALFGLLFPILLNPQLIQIFIFQITH